MGQVIPAGFGQATLEFDFINGPSNPMAIVFGYENDADQSPVANAVIIRDEYVSNVLVGGGISDNVRLLRVNVLQNPGGATGSAASNETGDNNQTPLPPQVAFLIKKQSATGGRTGRGRIYQPGPTVQGVLDGGVVEAVTLAALNTSFDEFNANLISNSIPMVILHAEPSVLAPVAVTNLTPDSLVATQRRRLRG